MKTYSQVQQERAQQAKDAQDAERDRVARAREYLETHVLTREIPLHAGATESSRQQLRDRILGRSETSPIVMIGVFGERSGPCVTGVACDHCETELFVPQPNVVTILGSQHVQCPGCGWSGYL